MYLKTNILKFILGLVVFFALFGKSQSSFSQVIDTVNTSIKAKKSDTSYHRFNYIRVGVDVSKLLRSPLSKSFNTYEFQIDINYTKLTYLSLEFGGGNSIVENDNLKYNSNNYFGRIGIDKIFFGKEFLQDMDNAFVGIRYAMSSVKRDQATYTITDQNWGNTSGIIPATNFLAHWFEITGGFRIELAKNVFAGWNIRAKTFINPKKFELLPPSYVAGYGRGDKNTAVDYNLYLLYGIGKRK